MNMHCLGWNSVLDSYSLKMLIKAHEILALFTCWYQSVWSLATSPGACVFLLLGNLDKGMSPSEQDKQCLVYVMQMKLFILAWLHVGSRVDLCWLSLSWICRKDYKVNLTLWGWVTLIYMRQYHCHIPTLLQIMACRLFGTKPLSEPMLPYCQLDHKVHISVKFHSKFKRFHSRNCTRKCLWNVVHFVAASVC